MGSKSLITKGLFLISVLLFSNFLSAEPNLDEGKALFKANCATCHNKNMKDKMTGPALAGYADRWEGKEELLYAWIRNSQAVIAAGDSYAVSLYKEWNNSVMTAFPNLTDQQIEDILGYVDGVADGTYGPQLAVVAAGETADTPKESNTFLYITLLGILAILALVLARIISNLSHLNEVKLGNVNAQRRTLSDLLTSRGVVGLVLFGLIVLGGFTTVNNAIQLGRQQGYAPDQPIKFSHATHSGLQKIDCQYCHDGARRSKHSVIPAANTCMNCHKAIKKGSTYGTAELTKIYASIGYDPNTDLYIDGYTEKSNEEVEPIYKKWITDNFIGDNEATTRYDGKPKLLEEAASKEATNQWNAIVSSLTHEQKSTVSGPIEWKRIHNLPDHAYFNHAQHVSIGKVECQQCHGPIEQMEVVAQHAPLSMGWCVNCHRQTEVKFAENGYYESYHLYKKQMEEGTRDKVTVEEIGGLECQKCHY
ncbi:MAG: c-type cytochrome [Saprospiraceae bacterium]|nr:c-type cytochrome [Saprospiraceae bacterium]